MQKRIKIIDSFGDPLPWANIVTAQGKGTISDDEGFATVEASTGNQQITISFIGFQTRTMTFNNLPDRVILEPDVNQLDPVVITAPKKKEKTDWATYASIGIGVISILIALSGNDEPQEVIPVKPKNNARKVTL
ncbi:carboxypeptidase-like regulatory domain-containing protein [Leeuwenhoekiella polynyae]|uniref:Carboxypeptidase-like protein n=1 Tax=Leeuwenhoekiella polynyae TaxID=1550906 RepID=A0A4V1KRQ2_9FLAO|nr:carboxypeptidase-like regulatory domain-containing protein [Leeuwenhoekiella polynyae]RXG25702.1 hypothetical protein DSM02_869 [Leeuwenhoekiella polynyae]